MTTFTAINTNGTINTSAHYFEILAAATHLGIFPNNAKPKGPVLKAAVAEFNASVEAEVEVEVSETFKHYMVYRRRYLGKTAKQIETELECSYTYARRTAKLCNLPEGQREVVEAALRLGKTTFSKAHFAINRLKTWNDLLEQVGYEQPLAA